MEKIIIGTILKPIGIKGEVKVKVFTNNLSRFLRYDKFTVDGVEIPAEKVRVDGQFGYIKFVNCDKVEEAEKFRNKDVLVSKSEMPKLDKDEYYIADLVGCNIAIEDGESLGTIVEVLTETRNATIIAKGEKSYIFPVIKDLIISVDKENKMMRLNKVRFEEVSLIED